MQSETESSLHGQPEAQSPLGFLSGGGNMGAMMRNHDWNATILGPPETWPQSLRSALSICLESPFQVAIYWGSELSLLYNDAWSQIPGDKHPWTLGRPAREVWPEIWDTVGPLFSHVLSTGQATRPKDGLLAMHRRGFTEECYFDYTLSPIRDEAGAVGGIINIAVETTFRVLDERRQRLLRDLREVTGGARNADEVCTLAASVLSKYPADLPFSLIYLTESGPNNSNLRLVAKAGIADPPPASRWLTKKVNAGAPTLMENIGKRLGMRVPGGPWPELCDRALVVPIPSMVNAEPAGFLVGGLSPRLMLDLEYRSFVEHIASSVAADIARARAYEEERRRAEALAEIDRAKTTFFSNISHEFRTPLTLMLGPMEDILQQEPGLTTPGREQLALAHRNGLRLQKLVNALLDFSRIEAGRAQATYEPTNLAELTEQLASNFRSACARAGIGLIVDCPPTSELVYVDREMWEKIVLNLISNAFKFTLEGSIEVSLRQVGANAELQIKDTGVGIPEAELPYLFERFHRVEGSRGRSMEGSGIGLALVQELVKLHGGSVWAESVPDKGSTFHVSLPLGAAHLPPERIGAGRPAVSTSMVPGMFIEESLRWLSPAQMDMEAAVSREVPPVAEKRGNVLLADDNADMRAYVERLLQDRFHVTAVPNGEEALRAAVANPPDLVLADVMMPGLDGFGLLQALRADPNLNTIPVILLSARAGEESRVEGLDAGADDYLTKPFSARELIARVTSHLEISRFRKEALESVRRAEATLRENQVRLSHQIEEFETLFREVPVGIAVARDAIGENIRINPAFTELLGIPADVNASKSHPDGKSLPFRVFQNGREVPDQELPMQVSLREGRPIRGFELDILRQDGTTIVEYGHAVPLLDDEGKVRGGIAVFVDLTERKRAEEALRKSESELRLANQELEQFAYSAAHDLQEPLRTVSVYVELLRRKYPEGLDPEALSWISYCHDAADRMGVLIRDLLHYSRAASTPEASHTPVDLNEVARGALTALRTTVEESGAEVVIESLPALVVEPVRFQQVFQNLIGNALKYSYPGRKPQVRVSAEKDGDWIFSVHDNGIGIDSQYHSQVFEMFKRLHEKKQTGTGLGLTICQKIVERYGGRIWVESTPGDGATFRFSLPARLGGAGLGRDDGSGKARKRGALNRGHLFARHCGQGAIRLIRPLSTGDSHRLDLKYPARE